MAEGPDHDQDLTVQGGIGSSAFGAYAHDQFSPGWPRGTPLRPSAPV